MNEQFQYGIEVESVTFQTVKNNDMREATVERNGEILLRVAIANGFRNIQNLVQKMKRKKCSYDYVEVMACPSGSYLNTFHFIIPFHIGIILVTDKHPSSYLKKMWFKLLSYTFFDAFEDFLKFSRNITTWLQITDSFDQSWSWFKKIKKYTLKKKFKLNSKCIQHDYLVFQVALTEVHSYDRNQIQKPRCT